MPQKEHDRSDWHYIQAPEEMFLLKRYDFDDDTRYLLRRWLHLGKPDLRIVEMGSGSGYFTEQLLKTANQPRITCIEPDEVLIDYAKKRLGEEVTFKKGFVEDPPLRDDVADLVICHVLLCNVPDMQAAVRGMVKVAKPEGTVCSIEPVFLGGYSPDSRAELIVEGHSANIEGAWVKRKELIRYPKEYPYSKYVYPRIFAECGLNQIEVHGLASSYYSGDQRLKREDLVQDAKEWLDLLERHRDRYEANLTRIGWKRERIEAFFKAWRDLYTEEVRYPSKLPKEHTVYVKSSIVTIGKKTRK